MSYLVRVVVQETDSTPIPSASVGIRRGSEYYKSLTNTSGIAEFAVDDGNWTITAYKTGFSYAVSTVSIGSDTTVTITLDSLLVSPSPPGTVNAYSKCYYADGTIASNVTIYYTLAMIDQDGCIIKSDRLASATSDTNGLIVFPNLFKGGRYKFTSDFTKWDMIDIPNDAADPYQLQGLVI